MARPDPETLFARYASEGDVGALAEVFDRLAPELLRLARRLVAGEDRAEDLVQETFLTALEQPQSFEAGARLEPWLVGILVNRARSQRRRERRAPELDRMTERTSPEPDRELDRAERQGAVAAAVRELPPQLRAVVEAKLAGRDAGQTARELGISRGAARVRLHRALQRMRTLLPPSLATPFALLLMHSTGLGAVRARVLGQARQLGAAKGLGLFPSLAIGWTWMTKKTLAAAAVVVFGLSWIAVQVAGAPPASQRVHAIAEGPGPIVPSGAGRSELTPAGDDTALAPVTGRREADPASRTSSSLTGRVIDPQGLPVGEATVEVWLGRGARTRYEREDPDRRVRADSGGSFELDDLEGPFVLVARTDELACVQGLTGELEPGAQVRAPDLLLAPAWQVTGVVLDPDLNPLKGAEVWLGEPFSQTHGTDQRGLWTFRAGRGLTRTDGRGAFELAGLPEENPRLHVELAPYMVHRGGLDRSVSPPRVVLDPGPSLSGVVLDARGEPAAGAQVRRFPHWTNVHTAPETVATDAAGRFVLPAMVPSDQAACAISVVHPGHAVAVVQPVRPGPKGEPVVVRLDPERVLAGRVVTETGEPAAGVRVRIEGTRELDPGYSMGRRPTWEWAEDLDEQVTDGGGSFRFEQLYPGPFVVEVGDASGQYARIEADAGREDLRVVLGHTPGRVTLVGRVVDATTEAPVTAFSVVPMIDGSGAHRPVEDPDGRFQVQGLTPGRIDVSIIAEGYAQRRIGSGAFEAGEHRLDARLVPLRSVTLSVVRPDGRPVSGGRVRAYDAVGEALELVQRNAHGGSLRMAERPLTDGGLTLHGLPAERITLVALVADCAEERIPLDLTEPLAEPLRVVVRPLAMTELKLLVLGEGALPDPEAFVRLWARADPLLLRESVGPDWSPADLLDDGVELLLQDGQQRPLVWATIRKVEHGYALEHTRIGGGGWSSSDGLPALDLLVPTGPVRVLRVVDGELELLREFELTVAGGEVWESVVIPEPPR